MTERRAAGRFRDVPEHRDELARLAVFIGHASCYPSFGGLVILCLLGLSRRHRWARRFAYIYLWFAAVGGVVVVVIGVVAESVPAIIVGAYLATFCGWQVSVSRPALAAYALDEKRLEAERAASK